jgi:hypothetical protein
MVDDRAAMLPSDRGWPTARISAMLAVGFLLRNGSGSRFGVS